jgi:hypothetical protein
MSKQKKFGFLFIAVIILCSSFIFYFYKIKRSYKAIEIPYKEISVVAIFDRGLVDQRLFVSDNKDSNITIGKLLLESELIPSSEVNLKTNHGFCKIELFFNKKKPIKMNLTAVSNSIGIIKLGNRYYQNDNLLKYVVNKFKANR